MARRETTSVVILCTVYYLTMLTNTQAQELVPPTITHPRIAEDRWLFLKNPHTERCLADGVPDPTFEWYWNGQLLRNDDDVYFYSDTGDLNFRRFEEDQQGDYMCVATNKVNWVEAKAMSPPITMKANILDPFLNDGVTTTLTEDEFNYLMVECANKGTIQVEDPQYSWYEEDSSSQLADDNGRLFIDKEGNLHFSYLKEEDKDISTYRCGVSNQKTNIALGSPTKITVNKKVNPSNAIAPQLRYSNTGVKAMIYSDAVLECFFSGYDPAGTKDTPQTKWFDDASKEINPGENDPKYALSEDGRQLTVKNVQELDEKNFYCMGSNSGGDTKKIAVFLNVTSPPIFEPDGQPQDAIVTAGSTAVLHCNARSLKNENPPETPVWYINAEDTSRLSLDPRKFSFNDDNTRFTITGVKKPDDTKCIQCKVSNEYGDIWGNGCLNVIMAITVTVQPDEVQEVTRGDVVDLTFVATSDPSFPLSYQWQFNNKTSDDPPPFVTYDPNTFKAVINTSALSEEEYDSIEGVYKRIIYNTEESKVVQTKIILMDVVPPVPVKEAGISMWVVGLIIGILFLIIVIIIIICVVCRRQQEGNYYVDKKETGAGLDPKKELMEKGFNEYSRPRVEDYEFPDKKPHGELDHDDLPIMSDEDDESLAEYEGETGGQFNESGVFIADRNGNKRYDTNESTM